MAFVPVNLIIVIISANMFREQNGTSANCTQLIDVLQGNTCQRILHDYGLTMAQFFAWNPAVGSDCSKLWLSKHATGRHPQFLEMLTRNHQITNTAFALLITLKPPLLLQPPLRQQPAQP